MLAIVLWSVAVYGGAAAICLRAAHRWIARIGLREALWLAALPLLFTGRATLTGGVYAPLDILYHFEPFASQRAQAGIERVQTPILSDVVSSMIPWQAAVRDAIEHGRAPLWNRHVLAGEPLLAVQQPAVLHPGTWIGLLLPLPQAWTFQMSLRLFVALLSAFLFLRDIGCREVPALIGAAGWGFSEFMVFWVGYPVGTAGAPFPLLLLGLARLVRDADRRAVALTLAALFLLIAAGHPEMLLFEVAGGGLYFLFLLAFAGRGRRGRPILLALAAGALALGLTAAQLIPLVEAMPQTFEASLRRSWYSHVPKSVGLAESARRAVPALLPFSYADSGGSTREAFGSPGGYAGALLLPLAATGLFSRDRRRFALLALGLLGLAVATRLPVVTDALTALPLFDIGQTNYMVFLSAFAVCALAALGAGRLSEGEGRHLFLASSALTAIAIAALHRRFGAGLAQLEMTTVRRRLVWELAVLILASLALARRVSRPGGVRVAALLGLLVVSRVAESGDIYPTCPARAFYPRLAVLDGVPRGAPERIVGLGQVLIPNSAAMYGLEDARGYESMTFRPLVETFPLWCTPQPVWFNRVDDLEKPFLSFLNVRYALVPHGLAPPVGWVPRARDPGADLLENTRCLARAFVPERIRTEPDGARRLEILATISDFGERGVVESAAVGSPGNWVRNGKARVEIRDFRPQSMTLEVDAEETAVVATSIPAWKGWKASLDGAAVPAIGYNHAFLAFRVPSGKHELELRYLSDGFVLGAWISLLSCAAAFAWCATGPKRDSSTRVLSCEEPRP